jgi:uncharacterized protein (TIGR00255 family)
MRSMTGFGLGQAPLGGGRICVELRALNHRYLDIRVRMPQELADQSFFVEQLARERVTRGRFDIGVRIDGAALPPPRFDIARARAAYRSLKQLRDELAPGTDLPVSALLGLPELFTGVDIADADRARKSLESAFDDALARLDVMRSEEGKALRRELEARLATLRQLVAEILARSGQLVESYRVRLSERLTRLLGDVSVAVESGRLEAELAIMADRTDVTEELVRLQSHFDQFERLIAASGAVGRRLDFLLQEISREANTIGAKSQDASLSHLIVDVKAEVERMREQVQNVE